MNKKKLFIFDLDGTVLIPGQEPYAKLPDQFSKFLDSISKDGWMWGINSTWDVNGQWHLVLVSNVKSRPSFLIGEMGLRIVRVKKSCLEFIQPYTRDMERKVQEIIEKELYPLMRRICSKFNPAKMYFYGHMFHFIAGEKEKEKFDDFIGEINVKNFVVKKGNGSLVAYPSILNKGEPVRELMRITGLSPEQIVVAGDEPADIQMMEPSVSRHPICPYNASEEVKRHIKAVGGITSTYPYAQGVMEAFTSIWKHQE
ncbi:MAG: HAD family hydrolase [Candidatus Omnitrophica bacterium]|nr:HAD family hydrolase [Candidatus Omnitrophota bacterium]